MSCAIKDWCHGCKLFISVSCLKNLSKLLGRDCQSMVLFINICVSWVLYSECHNLSTSLFVKDSKKNFIASFNSLWQKKLPKVKLRCLSVASVTKLAPLFANFTNNSCLSISVIFAVLCFSYFFMQLDIVKCLALPWRKTDTLSLSWEKCNSQRYHFYFYIFSVKHPSFGCTFKQDFAPFFAPCICRQASKKITFQWLVCLEMKEASKEEQS